MDCYGTEMMSFMDGKHPEVLSELSEQKEIGEELEEKIVSALNEFKKTFSI